MSGIQVTIPLQMVCRLMIATQAGQKVTLPSNWTASLVENEAMQVVLEQALGVATSLPRLPSGYVAFPEFGAAYKLFETAMNYEQARKLCFEENGQLAVIDSREKAERILNNYSNAEYTWVGLHLFEQDIEWTTIDGKSTNNLPWARGKPSGSYECGSLSRSQNGLINQPCTNTFQYLCEITLPRN